MVKLFSHPISMCRKIVNHLLLGIVLVLDRFVLLICNVDFFWDGDVLGVDVVDDELILSRSDGKKVVANG